VVDIGVKSVWNEYRGAGVRVAVVDDGFDYDHFELTKNYDRTRDQDVIQWDNDARNGSGNNHGTAVMGVIGADDNGLGTIGVASDATLIGLRMGYGSAGSFDQIVNAFRIAKTHDVVNNSWNYSQFFADNFDMIWMRQGETELISGVNTGRGGLGTNFIFAAGNTRGAGDDVNFHNFQNSIYTTSVGAIDSSGRLAGFSTPGAAVHLVAPGVGVLTTDITGGAGYSGSDFAWMNGTSFAAPTVSGVVALMLQANKNLAYRDVQEILAYSARLTDGAASSWKINAADNWNGGGLHTSTDYGFGVVNAHDAVRLSETWTVKSTYAAMDVATAFVAPALPVTVGTYFSDLVITRALDIDKIEIDLRLTHDWIGELRISLLSPEGTESVIVDRPGVARGGSGAGTSMDNINFTMTSNQFWGEDSVGTWRLKVEDLGGNGTGRLDSWRLNVFGDDVTHNDQYIFTDEFATYGMEAARRLLVDTRGLDTVNGSALTGSMNFDLRTGGTIAGHQVTIQSGSFIERLYGGDAGDILTGNSGANSIWGGRGNDVLTGLGGNDRFLFGRNSGHDVITDFHAGDLIVLRDGITARHSGSLITFSDGGTVTAANNYLWKSADFVYG
jgi:subtilisin-like proprotein convertase family protein